MGTQRKYPQVSKLGPPVPILGLLVVRLHPEGPKLHPKGVKRDPQGYPEHLTVPLKDP
nr:hypothetical protein [uncultured Marinifilum sp.]